MNVPNGASEIETALAERRICSDCVGEEFLRARIVNLGDQAKCFYCGKVGKTFSVDDMADEIQAAFDEHFYQTGPEAGHLQAVD